ncbi:MAG: hypothetical protein FWG13_03880 [Leptospirales bacterium]|nr:hypothetical protein [Leptospirales bacterium]
MKFKKQTRFFTIAALLIALTFTIASCGAGIPDGTYVHNKNSTRSLTFSGNKVTTVMGKYKTEDTYKIKDGKLVFFLSDYGGKPNEVKYSIEGNKLTIAGQEYTKQ